MSSPFRSLDKSRKPLTNPSRTFGKRSMPFRPGILDTTPDLLNGLSSSQMISEEATSSPDNSSISPSDSIDTAINKLDNNTPPETLVNCSDLLHPSSSLFNRARHTKVSHSVSTSTPTDIDLLSTMVKRITQLEKQTAFYTKEVVDKDKKIKILEEKVTLLNRYKNPTGNVEHDKITFLENKCKHLQEQVQEMEQFLSDYGMIWIGDLDDEADDSSPDEYRSPVITVNNLAAQTAANLPNDRKEFTVDYNQIIKNIEDLNIIANEDGKAIEKTKDGARFNSEESISLTLYSNGIFMFNGPFRSFEEPTTKRCLKDIYDGYFPSELQHLYPEGVAIKVTDMRETTYKDPKCQGAFSGVGYSLLSQSSSPPSESDVQKDVTPLQSFGEPVLSSNIATIHNQVRTPPQGTQQFLDKIPKSVVRNGKVVDVRDSLRDLLSGNTTPTCRPSTEVVCTQTVEEMQDRMKIPETSRPTSARDITTIRIKSENGKKTYLLKMKFHDTIADLYKYIDKQRPAYRGSYEIMSTFPNRKHTDMKKSLAESGLTPNAALHLKPIMKATAKRKPFC